MTQASEIHVVEPGRIDDTRAAYSVGAQTIYQVFGLFAGPFLIHHGGVNAMLTLFAALCVLGLLLVRLVPVHGRIQSAVPSVAGLLSRPVLLALAGCFLFYVNIGAYWTSIERIGTTAGIGLNAISNALAFSTVGSMAGVFLASWLGGRRGFVGVGFEDRKVLLGHKSEHVTTHYSAPEIGALIEASEKVCALRSRKSPALAIARARPSVST